MSGAAKPGKTVAGHAIDALSLAIVFGVLWGAVHLVPAYEGEAGVIAALGFLLLAGTLMSELVEVLGVPHLSGYLAAGIIAGPHVLHLIDHVSVKRLEPVNTLAIALIALAGGAELRLDGLKRAFRSLLVSSGLQTVLGIVLVGGMFAVVRPPFARELSFAALIGVSLLWGVLAITRSPSACLGVLSQTRASGPLAQFSLAFIMASDVVVVTVLATALTIARPLIEPTATLSAGAFRALGHEVLGSVSMGTTLGLLLAAYLRVSGRQLLVVLVALGFGATEVLHYLQLEPLLTFLVAGFVVQNLSRQGDKFLHAIEDTGGVVYVVFFASAGAHLNVPLLKEYWPIALLLTGSRAVVTVATSRLSSRIARDEPVVKKWGWAGLLSQAGVALGIAQVIARQFPAPSFGPAFRDLAIACIAINEMAGPVIFKLALDRAKETKAPAPSIDDADEVPAP
ncbi:MAG: cation:proton antiporter [Deltaproteobacteria bacterium]|nr:cation:proton antiporter [Deltaproteobacteria bacterium]